VVFVHGSLDRATSFARVVRRLGDLDVVTYDRRGYHRSRRAQRTSGRTVTLSTSRVGGENSGVFEQHVLDLLEVVGARRSVVIGHSFGGDIALGAAIASPRTVVAVGAYEPPMPWAPWWPRRRQADVLGEDPGAFAESFFRRVVSDEAWERLPERARTERRADGPALVAELAALRNGNVPFDIALLAVPAVLGRGELSLPHHRRAIDSLKDSIPDARVVEIPGASHGAHLSHPDAFADFVRLVIERAG
jgi:pimeloyl-ACP methyl ester carboxylesterase